MMSFREILKKRSKKSIETNVLGKLSVYDIIIKPIMTEKTYKQAEFNKYFFKVHKDSNKNDVKNAINNIYGVEPVGVNFVSVKYKGRARRGLVRRAYKKAIVTLSKKDSIEIIK